MKGTIESRLSLFPKARLALLPPRWAEEIAWPELIGQLLIVFSSRVGSTFLCRHIEKTRAASQIVEAFNTKPLRTIAARHALPSLESAVAWRMAGAVEAGWFVAKSGVPGLPTAEHIGHMARYGDVTRFWFLLRRDILAQAVSVGTAQISGQFHSTQAAQKDVTVEDYDAEMLTKIVRNILKGNQTLERYLIATGRGADVLFYEDFAEGDFTKVDAMLDLAGLPLRAEPQARPPADVHRVTRDVSADWRARLREAKDIAALVAEHERFIDGAIDRFG